MSNESKETETSEAAVKAAAVEMAPNSVAGQKYVSPAGRHSQQSHRRAQARAEALGLTTVRELYDHDRAAALAKLKKGADGALAQKKSEQDRKLSAVTEKAEAP